MRKKGYTHDAHRMRAAHKIAASNDPNTHTTLTVVRRIVALRVIYFRTYYHNFIVHIRIRCAIRTKHMLYAVRCGLGFGYCVYAMHLYELRRMVMLVPLLLLPLIFGSLF